MPRALPSQPVAPPPQLAQQRPLLLERMVAAAPYFAELVKDSSNDYLKSQYMSLPALLKAVKPPLLEQGVTIYSQVRVVDGFWVVRTTVSTVEGDEELYSDFPIPDTSSLQKIGAAVTYGVRYNVFALLAICAENDDDGNSASAPSAPAYALPGLPGGVQAPAAWPQPGQQVTAPPAMYQQAAAPMPMPAAPAIAHPVQPLPVLQ